MNQLLSKAQYTMLDLSTGGNDVSARAKQKVEQVAERYNVAVAVVLIVAMALVMIAGFVVFGLIAAQCISRGYNLGWYGPNGWRVWEMRITCTVP